MISECTKHDTIAVHLFQKNLIRFLTENFGKKPSKIMYVSMDAQPNIKIGRTLSIYAITWKNLVYLQNGIFLQLHMEKVQQMGVPVH